jgi:integral membrane protein (TIGR01906 family)
MAAPPLRAPDSPYPPPWWAGLMLVVAAAVLIGLVGPLLLFNPWFVSLEQARSDVPARLGTSQAEVDRATGGILCDLLFSCDDFGQGINGGPPLLTDDERSHMRDVGNLVRSLWVLVGLAILGAVLALRALRQDRRLIGRLLIAAGGLVGVIAFIFAAFFATAFDQAFLAFHELFFPQGNFLFGPDSNLLRLFPEGFWFETSLVAGSTIVLAALVASVVGWRLVRGSA